MLKAIEKIFLMSVFMLGTLAVSAQCEESTNRCLEHLKGEYISDGQNYRAMLVDEEVAEFRTTFYAGIEYRLTACSGAKDGMLLFKVYDQNRNLLFNSADYDNTPYWNFTSEHNLDCIIEATLNTDMAESGCAVLLLGFKN